MAIISIMDIYSFAWKICLLNLVSWIYQREAWFSGKVQQMMFFWLSKFLLMGLINWQTGTQKSSNLICTKSLCCIGGSPPKSSFVLWQRLTKFIVSRIVKERRLKVGWISPESKKEIRLQGLHWHTNVYNNNSNKILIRAMRNMNYNWGKLLLLISRNHEQIRCYELGLNTEKF